MEILFPIKDCESMCETQQRNNIFSKKKKVISDLVEELIAVNTLEYHNKNWLAGSNDSRSTETKCMLELIQIKINELKY